MENMRRCIDWRLGDDPVRVVDLGSMNVNGSYRELLPPTCDYVGVDLEPGPGVDVVLTDVYSLPFEDGSVDVVLSGQMLEHCGQFWRVFSEIYRILKPGGLAFTIAPSAGPVHRYPVDCYRFYPDSWQALADWSGLRLVQSWTDERGPWCDTVGIFQKGEGLQPVTAPRPAPAVSHGALGPHPDPAVEARGGARPYLEVLADLHQVVQPQLYLEIGVRSGASLALAGCPAIAIDPDPSPKFAPGPEVTLHRCTSDEFFFFNGPESFAGKVDLAFIDGMHLAEFVYRDFINVERVMSPRGVVVIDDVLPNHPLQAVRQRQSKVWTGDVWRFVELLAKLRKDLKLTWLDTEPSGLLVISNLNPGDRKLWSAYNPQIRKLVDAETPPPAEVISRSAAVAPTLENLRQAAGR
jgi:hypothetical protein